MHVTKAHACNTFANLQQNFINIHYNNNADFLEDKKLTRLRLEPTNYGLESSVVHC